MYREYFNEALEQFNCFPNGRYRIEWYNHGHSRLLLRASPHDKDRFSESVYLTMGAVCFISGIVDWEIAPLRIIDEGFPNFLNDFFYDAHGETLPIVLVADTPGCKTYFMCSQLGFSTKYVTP